MKRAIAVEDTVERKSSHTTGQKRSTEDDGTGDEYSGEAFG